MLNIDRLDARLLAELSRDARIGVGELASTLGVARNTVQARLRRLTDSRVLRGYQPDIDLAAVGAAVQAFVALEIRQSELQAIARALADLPEVLEVHATTGREDPLVRVATSTQADLQRLAEQIVSWPPVATARPATTRATSRTATASRDGRRRPDLTIITSPANPRLSE